MALPGTLTGVQITEIYATDLLGNVIWYFNDTYSQGPQYVDRPLPGGTVLALLGDAKGANQLVRAFDLVGNSVLETSTGRINEQLSALMTTPPLPAPPAVSALPVRRSAP